MSGFLLTCLTIGFSLAFLLMAILKSSVGNRDKISFLKQDNDRTDVPRKWHPNNIHRDD